MASKYQPQEFEKKWFEVWEKEKIYKTLTDIKKKKIYVLDMFPYPSGAGLHVGHPRGYTASDILARYYRMNGYLILHPMGWDAFGLPAENAAIKAKKNPMDMVPKNIATFKKQMQMLGFSYDWDRELTTTDPEYYKWTQWLFIQFFKMGLLYKKNTPINFCPSCKTGLAEEEVLPDGTHERCGNKIEKKDLPQWIFRITAYADRLLKDLKGLDWPEGILEMQKNWIGRSEGLLIEFKVHHPIRRANLKIEVFTSKPETIDGATFLVLAPEHAFLENNSSSEVRKYINQAKKKTEGQRKIEERNKTGVFTGYYAINPVTKKKIPIWVADYVLINYGTGAIMAVPYGDERDKEFAEKYNLPITKTSFSAKPEGKKQVNYHLRDWIFSRQRYWGEPIPMINCKKCGWQPVPEEELPLKLPYIKSYEPTETGESPLSKIPEFVNAKCSMCGEPAKRETDTMPNWAGSCWYFIRFAIQNDKSEIRNSKSETNSMFENWKLKIENSQGWLPVDWYFGGAEHAVLHLLYSRFWVKALQDLKLLDFNEPFLRLRNVGMVLAEDHRKMSKSLGNVINPDDVIKEYGADTLRLYEMFMAPFSQEISWSTKALQGAYRFLKRIWEIYQKFEIRNSKFEIKEDKNLISKLNKTIIKVTNDIENIKMNTAIASMMEFLNEWERKFQISNFKFQILSKKHAQDFLKVLAPFAPFISEEIWRNIFREKNSIHLSSWPKAEIVTDEIITIPVQINGKLRSTLSIKYQVLSIKEEIEKMAIKDEKIKKYLAGKKYKAIYVPGKILNFVLK